VLERAEGTEDLEEPPVPIVWRRDIPDDRGRFVLLQELEEVRLPGLDGVGVT
jgi:hypothetical protein